MDNVIFVYEIKIYIFQTNTTPCVYSYYNNAKVKNCFDDKHKKKNFKKTVIKHYDIDRCPTYNIIR